MEPKILVFDIETSPLLAYCWGLWENNVSLNQIHADWYILSFAAKWLDDSKVIYMDQRSSKNKEDDKAILKVLWRLLDEADVVVTQNGKKFDAKKVNARFAIHGFQPPSSYKHIDTVQLAKRNFGFTSNKLEYLSDKLCTQKKSTHKEFQGFELWKECLSGNPKAWAEMEKYNKLDVLATEELFKKLIPWGSTVNLHAMRDALKCVCGSIEFKKQGIFYTAAGRYQRYRCKQCGAETRSGENLLLKEQSKKMMRGTTR
jgi:DNA polymerase elongation subunit (family B)